MPMMGDDEIRSKVLKKYIAKGKLADDSWTIRVGHWDPSGILDVCSGSCRIGAVRRVAGQRIRITELIGAGHGIRTRDPQLGKLMLYQLS
jgi:hypothetical protein